MAPTTVHPDKLPWYTWLVAPFIVVFLLLWVPFLILFDGLCVLYPERTPAMADFTGTPHQKALREKWRLAYRKLYLPQRAARALKIRHRRRFLKTTHCKTHGHTFKWADSVPNTDVYECRFCKTQRFEKWADKPVRP